MTDAKPDPLEELKKVRDCLALGHAKDDDSLYRATAAAIAALEKEREDAEEYRKRSTSNMAYDALARREHSLRAAVEKVRDELRRRDFCEMDAIADALGAALRVKP